MMRSLGEGEAKEEVEQQDGAGMEAKIIGRRRLLGEGRQRRRGRKST